MRVIDCEQGTIEWHLARSGKATASEFHTVLAKGKSAPESKTRRTYMLKLAGEILTGEPATSFQSAAMQRGKDMEAEARDYYAFLAPSPVQRVGFLDAGNYGCSPDALVGDDGLLEIKTAEPHILIAHHLSGNFPAEHRAQCQGALWVTGRSWLDLLIYWPRVEPFLIRVTPDADYIAELAKEVDRFNTELAGIVDAMRAIGARKAA